jgi:hypothetical protein
VRILSFVADLKSFWKFYDSLSSPISKVLVRGILYTNICFYNWSCKHSLFGYIIELPMYSTISIVESSSICRESNLYLNLSTLVDQIALSSQQFTGGIWNASLQYLTCWAKFS